jgi:3-oxoacid CoA-transferase
VFSVSLRLLSSSSFVTSSPPLLLHFSNLYLNSNLDRTGFGLCGVAETLITALKNHPNLDDLSFVSNNAGITHTGGLAPLIEHEVSSSSPSSFDSNESNKPKTTPKPKVRKITLSYVGTNKALERKYLSGLIQLELSPQGSIAERLRCAGHGIPGVWTRTGVDTVVEHGGIVQKYVSDADTDALTVEGEPRERKAEQEQGKGSSGGYDRAVEIPGDKKETKIIDGKKYLFEPAIKGDVAILRAWKVDKAGNCRFR